jgi:hypothetical protein
MIRYRVIREEMFGRQRRAVIWSGQSRRNAKTVADYGTTGPDGIAVGCRAARYYIERRKGGVQ